MRRITAIMLAVLTGLAAPAAARDIVLSQDRHRGALFGNVILLALQDAPGKPPAIGWYFIVRDAIPQSRRPHLEHTGNAAFFITRSTAWSEGCGAGARRAAELDAPQGIIGREAAPANNTWAIALRRDGRSRGQVTMSDFGHIWRAVRFVGGPTEFVTSPAAPPAFQAAYGFTLALSS